MWAPLQGEQEMGGWPDEGQVGSWRVSDERYCCLFIGSWGGMIEGKRTIPRGVGGVSILCERGGCVPDGSQDSASQDRRECWVSEAMWGSLLIVSLFPVKEETRSWPEREEGVLVF